MQNSLISYVVYPSECCAECKATIRPCMPYGISSPHQQMLVKQRRQASPFWWDCFDSWKLFRVFWARSGFFLILHTIRWSCFFEMLTKVYCCPKIFCFFGNLSTILKLCVMPSVPYSFFLLECRFICWIMIMDFLMLLFSEILKQKQFLVGMLMMTY